MGGQVHPSREQTEMVGPARPTDKPDTSQHICS